MVRGMRNPFTFSARQWPCYILIFMLGFGLAVMLRFFQPPPGQIVVLKDPDGLRIVNLPVDRDAYNLYYDLPRLRHEGGESTTAEEDKGMASLVPQERVLAVDNGTRARMVGRDGKLYRLLILDGDQKGKTLLAQEDWFETPEK